MAYGKTLGEIIVQVQDECDFSSDPSKGQNFRGKIIHAIKRAQEFYFNDYMWPNLCGDKSNGRFEITTSAGENLYDLPATLDPITASDAYIEWSNFWTPLHYGICENDYALVDADDVSATLDPPQKWTLRENFQIEIWPRPASDDLRIRFAGRSKLPDLTDDSSVLVLDDSFIVQHAAASVLERKDPKLADRKMAKATHLYRMHRHNLEYGVKSNMAGNAEPDARDPRNKIFVGVTRG